MTQPHLLPPAPLPPLEQKNSISVVGMGDNSKLNQINYLPGDGCIKEKNTNAIMNVPEKADESNKDLLTHP